MIWKGSVCEGSVRKYLVILFQILHCMVAIQLSIHLEFISVRRLSRPPSSPFDAVNDASDALIATRIRSSSVLRSKMS